MRIAIVSPYSWASAGGVNNHVAGLSAHLAGRGHSVTVIAPDAAAEIEGVNVVSAGRSLPVPANGSVACISFMPGTSSRVRRAITDGGFDVVHVHEPLVPLVSTAAVGAACCRVVATFHSAGSTRSLAYSLGKLVFRSVPLRLDARVAVSKAAVALASHHLGGEYQIIPNGLDVAAFGEPRDRGVTGAGTGRILFVGRNEPRKGLDVLLRAFAQVSERVPGATLRVIGSGFTCEAVSADLPQALRENIEVAGFVPNDLLPTEYASADVFCAPALGGESFGIVLAESMAAGTPVVASDIPGYAAVVEQAGGGITFRCGDPADLSRALVSVLRDPGLRGRLGEAGVEGSRQFSWEVVGPKLEKIYAP
jgi:phosphatidyl-myo-inositol alpha-mannosyltransferase